RRFVNVLAAEVPVEFVFVIVVEPEIHFLTVRREFLFFIEHNKPRRAPWLPGPANVAPEFVIRLKIATTNEIISRRLLLDPLEHRDACLMDPFRHGLTSRKKQREQKKFRKRRRRRVRKFHRLTIFWSTVLLYLSSCHLAIRHAIA